MNRDWEIFFDNVSFRLNIRGSFSSQTSRSTVSEFPEEAHLEFPEWIWPKFLRLSAESRGRWTAKVPRSVSSVERTGSAFPRFETSPSRSLYSRFGFESGIVLRSGCRRGWRLCRRRTFRRSRRSEEANSGKSRRRWPGSRCLIKSEIIFLYFLAFCPIWLPLFSPFSFIAMKQFSIQ